MFFSSDPAVSSSIFVGAEREELIKNVLVENDAWTRKQKANEKNNPSRSSKKMSKQTDSESSKNIGPGEILQVGLTDGGRPRCPLSLGNGQRPVPRKENTCTVVCIEL